MWYFLCQFFQYLYKKGTRNKANIFKFNLRTYPRVIPCLVMFLRIYLMKFQTHFPQLKRESTNKYFLNQGITYLLANSQLIKVVETDTLQHMMQKRLKKKVLYINLKHEYSEYYDINNDRMLTI